MHQTCTLCSAAFEILDSDISFYEQVSPVIAGERHVIPPPTLCPTCRQRQRYVFRNERKLYRRKSCITGKDIVTAYNPECTFNVCEKDEWLKLDNTEHGRDVDFSRSFFEQFGELFAATTKANVIQNGENINSDYAHFCGWLKNCYLTFDSGKSEDCMYTILSTYCTSCFDMSNGLRNERCYDIIDASDCYHLVSSTFCTNCSHSAFLRDCIGCKSCLCCTNLRNKEYHIFNEPVSKEEFEKKWSEVFSGSRTAYEDMQTQWQEFQLSQPQRCLHNIDAKGCTGDYLMRCENATDCYECSEARNIHHCQNTWVAVENCHDISTFGEGMEHCYQLSASGGTLGKSSVHNCCFSVYIFYGGYNIFYSMNCHDNCKDLFGCSDLRGGKQYCILNKQYSKEEYERLVPKVIDLMKEHGEWGQFFPVTLSPFGYNETVAQECLPLERDEALAMGFRWRDTDDPIPDVAKIVDAVQLPDSVTDTPDDVLDWAIRCEVTGRPFRIMQSELQFYRDMGLPLPWLHHEERHRRRVRKRNPRSMHERKCAKCGAMMQTTYPIESSEVVYCERCYADGIY